MKGAVHSNSVFLVVRALPGFIGIIELHVLEDCKRLGAQVFLKDDSGLVDDEGLDARDPILCRGRGESETANHCAFHDKVHFAHRRGWPLSFQDFEEVSMVWLTSVRIALLQRFRNAFSNWAAPSFI